MTFTCLNFLLFFFFARPLDFFQSKSYAGVLDVVRQGRDSADAHYYELLFSFSYIPLVT